MKRFVLLEPSYGAGAHGDGALRNENEPAVPLEDGPVHEAASGDSSSPPGR